MPIGGKYRLIDVPISNCLHSSIDKIFVLTQFNSASLHRHISATYRFDSFSDAFVEILAAEQTVESPEWYQGTADAVRQQLNHIMSPPADQCLILSGDHLYRMNYELLVSEHRERQADVSIAVKPVTREEARHLGILKMDATGRVMMFREKPQTDEELDELQLDEPPGENPDELYLASMGIYLFERQALTSLLMEAPHDDFGTHIIPKAVEILGAYAHAFDGYWEDIGTIRSFYEATLKLTQKSPPFEFYNPEKPIYTHQRHLAGSRIEGCRIDRAIIAEGCHIRDAEIEDSVVGLRSVIGPGARIYHSVIMGADLYETAADIERNVARELPNIGIGAGTVVNRAIVDKNARIGEGAIIGNDEGIQEADGEGYYIRDGIVVVPKDGVIRPGARI